MKLFLLHTCTWGILETSTDNVLVRAALLMLLLIPVEILILHKWFRHFVLVTSLQDIFIPTLSSLLPPSPSILPLDCTCPYWQTFPPCCCSLKHEGPFFLLTNSSIFWDNTGHWHYWYNRAAWWTRNVLYLTFVFSSAHSEITPHLLEFSGIYIPHSDIFSDIKSLHLSNFPCQVQLGKKWW